MNIHFEKVNNKHKNLIFSWLTEPHVQEFWDNSHEHKESAENEVWLEATKDTGAVGTIKRFLGCRNTA